MNRRQLINQAVSLSATRLVPLTIGGAVIGALSACAAPKHYAAKPSAPLSATTVRNGDSWRYRIVNLHNGETRDTITASAIVDRGGLRVVQKNGRDQVVAEDVYVSPWAATSEQFYDTTLTFNPPLQSVPAHLDPTPWIVVNTTFTTKGSSTKLPWRQSTRMLGWESITVPAGQFECARIEKIINFRHHDSFRHESVRYEALWYAPKVNRWVRRDWSGTFMWDGDIDDNGVRRSIEGNESWQLEAYNSSSS
jgi:hypothetical protein